MRRSMRWPGARAYLLALWRSFLRNFCEREPKNVSQSELMRIRGVATPLIRINSDWETFFGSRSQKFRKKLRHKANKYARAPGHRIERRIVTSPDDPVFDQLQEVSRHSWKGKVGTDLASVPAARAFLH